MNHLRVVLFLVIGFVSFLNCEKDDICDGGDTPLLVIRFYDDLNTTELKEVPGLVVRGLDGTDTLEIIENASLDSIAIPLRVDQTSTAFVLSTTTTENDETIVNEDTVTFNYETNELFFSRGCGFIVNYENLSTTGDADDVPWITEVRIDSTSIKNSISAHVKILH